MFRAWRAQFSVPGCSRGSQGGSLRCAAIGGHGFRSLAALRSSQGRFAVPFPSPLFFLFIDTNYILRVPGCYAKQPGWSTVCRARARLSIPGCSRGSQGAVYGLPPSAGVFFGPWLRCEAAGEGLLFLSLAPFFFRFLILTIYLGSLAAARSSQGGLRSAALGGRGFRSLAARVAARGAVYGVPRSAGVIFGPWLLYQAASGVYGVPRAPGTVFGSWLLAWQPGRRSQSTTLSGRGFWSLAAFESSQGGSTVCHVRRARSFSFFSVFHVHRQLFNRSK